MSLILSEAKAAAVVDAKPRLIFRGDARRRVGVSHSTWWRMGRDGLLPEAVKIRGRWFYRLAEFEAFERELLKHGATRALLKPPQKKPEKKLGKRKAA